ncbi:MAG TPA: TonB-dependent receptor, partial [Sphingomonadales bacterium]
MNRTARVARGKRIRSLGLVSFLALGLGQVAAAADGARVEYDIPAQSLGAALKSFAQQSNVQVMFAPEAVEGIEAPAVRGLYQPDAALGQLLARANLDYRYVGDNMVVVSAATASAAPAAAPQSGRENSAAPEPAAAPAAEGAQESQNSHGFQIDEILVTASKRSLRLQDVPMAVSALDASRLDRMGAKGFNDYLRSIPGVSFIDRGPGRNKIIIRGISDGPNSGTESTTGIYIDETPITEALQTADINMFDVERVEVLRGPQGTLYGAGSMGGTVRIILNKPDSTAFGAAAEGTLSTTRRGGENYEVNGMVNVPVIEDRLAVRVVGNYREEGGYIDDVVRNIKDANEATIKGGRAMVQFTPSDDLTILGSVTYQDTEYGALPAEDLARGNFQQGRLYSEHGGDEWYLYSLEVDYDFGGVQLTSVTSYFEKDTLARLDYSDFIGEALGLGGVAFGLQ